MAKKAENAVEAKLRKYEFMFIFQPDLLESSVEKKLREFDKYLEENGGKIEVKDNWGKRKLAYRIGKHDEGIYITYNAMLPTTFNKELDEHFRIDKDVIRHMIVSVDEDYSYQKFADEPVTKPATPTEEKKPSASHKSTKGEKKSEVKDKGKKADAGSLDDKLDKILEGGDINV